MGGLMEKLWEGDLLDPTHGMELCLEVFGDTFFTAFGTEPRLLPATERRDLG